MAAAEGSKNRERNLQDADGYTSLIFQPGVAVKTVNDMYDVWAKDYDRTVLGDKEGSNWGPLAKMSNEMAKLFPPPVRSKVAVLDVGAGTGLGGQKLKDLGFLAVEALDPSAGMLKEAKSKGVYRNFHNCLITAQPLDIPPDTYDAITMTGALHHGAVQCEAFEEMTRLVKPGGYIVNCMRLSFLEEVPEYKRDWEPTVSRLQKEGKWTVHKTERYPNHYQGKIGLLIVFKVC